MELCRLWSADRATNYNGAGADADAAVNRTDHRARLSTGHTLDRAAIAQESHSHMMSAIDAAYQVLVSVGEPLHSNEIARRILAEGLWASNGKTPGATVDARIAVDIKAQGTASRFRRVGRSMFAAYTADQL